MGLSLPLPDEELMWKEQEWLGGLLCWSWDWAVLLPSWEVIFDSLLQFDDGRVLVYVAIPISLRFG